MSLFYNALKNHLGILQRRQTPLFLNADHLLVKSTNIAHEHLSTGWLNDN
tara:strand:- start:969 stop:1118 length:150 start_codon:yes stop_codon:yes gene_type:complete